MRIKILGLIISLLILGCAKESTEIKFVEIKNDIVRFDIMNNSDKDIAELSIEITYLSENKSVVSIDTIQYKGNTIFLNANESTFIVQKVPDQCNRANAKLINISYINN